MNGLTVRQQQVLDLLLAYQNEHGYAPTYNEIASLMGLASPNAAVEHIRALEKKRMLTVQPGIPRSIRITGAGTAEQQRDELLAALGDLYRCNPGSAERAVAILKRHGRLDG